MAGQHHGSGIVTIDDVFSEQECLDLVKTSEQLGFEEALISGVTGDERRIDVRNNDRIIRDDPEIADRMWRSVARHVPDQISCWTPFGANQRVRFYRYSNGQQFNWHSDGFYATPSGERSKLTYLTYLNDDFYGGETCFRFGGGGGEPKIIRIQPRRGLGLVFPHRLVHRGSVVTSGKKYVLRTDIMCRRTET